jgi:segregation and condensation protein B
MSTSPEPRSALEALIFAGDSPTTVASIRRALPELTPSRIPGLVDDINEQLERSGRPYRIASVAAGYQFRTRPEFADVLLAAQPERKLRLSKAALETLAVIVYRQPVTRAQIEELRCVDCGAVLRSLLERGLARIVGRRDAPGRPVLYGSTARFLETFGLDSLTDLPTLPDIAGEAYGGTPVEADAGTEATPPIDAEARAVGVDGLERSEAEPA